ncbi:unnamed protein product [Rotaria sordida]|uniref:Uncharacterized protein n=1 Tax=Rotaria sordida TaxID=392033 RepID=A0A818J497_9BILA|nr:unnamed protein product [Rotaria sordida]CAF3532191.1 unnamed protein product [Rotaria sordida]
MIVFINIILIFNLFFHICESTNNNPPVIIEQPQDILAELDKPMALHCRAEASSLDDLRVNWYKDGQLVTMDPNARIITEFMALHVINTMPQDAGTYYCVAENLYGRTQSRKAKVEFIRLDKEFLISPTSTTASIGERIRLRCEPPHGSPTPIVYWTKNGKNLSLPLDHYDLILPSIQTTDFGSYRCVASNGLIRQSSIAYLTEFHRPKIIIHPSTSRIDIERGKSINFQCQIENTNNDDQYHIEWHYEHKNGKIIGRNNHIDISSVQYDHSGLYICVVIYNNGRKRHIFSEEILLTVHEHLIINNEEKIFSQTNLNVYAGRSTIINCQLPFKFNEKIHWSIINHTYISFENNHRFEFIDKNQYRLKIRRIEEYDNDLLFECYYQNRKQLSQGLIKLHVERIESPPIIIYVPNNQTVPVGVEVNFPCQTKDHTKIQWWFISNSRLHKSIKIENNKKYKIESNHDLIIRNVDKNDVGTYKCIVTNRNDDETTWIAHLNVEDSRSNIIFHRVERTDLPQSPTQPLAIAINSNSIELAWNYPSIDIQGYLIEYFNLNNDDKNLQWKRLYTTNKNSRQIINDLKISSTYQFLIRAKNSFGYGQPSLLSELIETRHEQQFNDDFIYLLDPLNIQETSVTIQWNILQQNQFIDHYSISITNNKDINERIETIINKNNLTTYTITNLRPNTDYSIRIISLNNLKNIIGRPSNIILIRTLESIPLSSPINVIVELTSMTSLSIRWNPPLEFDQNGRIIAYKVNCLGSNESTSIRLSNISSDAKGLHIKSLIENMQYCISIAARTRVGYGPYSQPICVTMNADFLKLNMNLNQFNFKRRFHEAISQPWFLPLIIVSSILFTCVLLYACWLCFHRLIYQHRHRIKFGSSNSSSSSSSSSNQFVEMPIQKTLSNGTRYDLIKDTPPPSSSTALWTDTISSGIRLQCCTTTTASGNSQCEHDPHLINIHKNPINTLLQQSKQQQQQLNPYATTGIFQHNHSPQKTTSTLLPTYSESIRSPSSLPSHHYILDQQQPTSVQYQPPWLDHPSSSFQYRSQSHTPYQHQHHHHHYCIHCTSQSHPHTPSSIRTTTTRHMHNIPQQTNSQNIINNEVRWPIETTMNSSPIVKRQSQYAPPPSSSNPMMINSLGAETMTTSWASSTDGSNRESTSSSSSATHNNEQRKMINQHSRSSSEGSLFSDSDNQQDESNISVLNGDHERRPTFLMPNI